MKVSLQKKISLFVLSLGLVMNTMAAPDEQTNNEHVEKFAASLKKLDETNGEIARREALRAVHLSDSQADTVTPRLKAALEQWWNLQEKKKEVEQSLERMEQYRLSADGLRVKADYLQKHIDLMKAEVDLSREITGLFEQSKNRRSPLQKLKVSCNLTHTAPTLLSSGSKEEFGSAEGMVSNRDLVNQYITTRAGRNASDVKTDEEDGREKTYVNQSFVQVKDAVNPFFIPATEVQELVKAACGKARQKMATDCKQYYFSCYVTRPESVSFSWEVPNSPDLQTSQYEFTHIFSPYYEYPMIKTEDIK